MAKQPLVVKTIRLPKGLDKELHALSGVPFSRFIRLLAEGTAEKLRREAKAKADARQKDQSQ